MLSKYNWVGTTHPGMVKLIQYDCITVREKLKESLQFKTFFKTIPVHAFKRTRKSFRHKMVFSKTGKYFKNNSNVPHDEGGMFVNCMVHLDGLHSFINFQNYKSKTVRYVM